MHATDRILMRLRYKHLHSSVCVRGRRKCSWRFGTRVPACTSQHYKMQTDRILPGRTGAPLVLLWLQYTITHRSLAAETKITYKSDRDQFRPCIEQHWQHTAAWGGLWALGCSRATFSFVSAQTCFLCKIYH